MMLPALSKSKSKSGRVAIRSEYQESHGLAENASSRAQSEMSTATMPSTPDGDLVQQQTSQNTPTKIELPASTDNEPELQAKNENWSFAAGKEGLTAGRMGRGFVEPGARYYDSKADETKTIALGDAPKLGSRFGAIAPSIGLPGISADKDAARVDANDLLHLTPATPGARPLSEGKERGRDGAVSDTLGESTQPVRRGDTVVAEHVEEPAPDQPNQYAGGMMGGGSMASLNYYRSHPELMKRYFPQLYAQMQKDGGAIAGVGGSATAVSGLPGGPNVAEAGSNPSAPISQPPMFMPPSFGAGYDRYRMLQMQQQRPSVPPPPAAKPEQKVALQAEGKFLEQDKEEAEKLKQSKALGTTSQLSAANGNPVAEVGRGLAEVDRLKSGEQSEEELLRRQVAGKKAPASAAIPQPEVSTAENAFSTFSLNVSDVSFNLAAASLEKGLMPEAATVRSEEFINAFDYRDPEPQGAPIGFVWERARYPFAQDRDLLRFSVKTAASGREPGRPLNLVLLLDSSGSMERADRVRILQECLKALVAQLRPEDRISVVAFARTARLWIDGMPGSQAGELPQRVGNLTPEGGTNLEEAMKVAYETARKHFLSEGINRVVLLTDGAANLGDVEPESLKKKVEAERKKGIALDCFGIGWEGLNDELLETLSRNGDGRYGFVNTPEAAATEFAGQLAGALHVAASDVKVQVEFNPKRVAAYRQIGYAKHQLTKEQFRDNTVDAAEIGAAEAGNALYVVQVNAAGEGPLGTVRVRFKVPGTTDYREHAWPLLYEGAARPLETSTYPLRLAGAASAFSEWLVSSPYAAEVTPDRLLTILSGAPEHFALDPRPKKLEWMIRQAKSLAGK
jgi:Mg-chelatase subunit ChlD